MGYGDYSQAKSTTRSVMYSSQSRNQIFKARELQVEMKPDNIIRECCDSEDHPESIPMIIGLDVTGSMGRVPESFIRDDMSKMMASLYEANLKDSQVLFMGIGDHKCDRAPLQIGQFEADDELLDKWLKEIYLEGHGGGNGGESYFLAWQFAAECTKLDSFNKRNEKGFLFTIGDEPVHRSIDVESQKRIFGSDGSYKNRTADELLGMAMKTYNVFHIHITETMQGNSERTQNGWRELMGDNVLFVDSFHDISKVISDTVRFSNERVLTEPPVNIAGEVIEEGIFVK